MAEKPKKKNNAPPSNQAKAVLVKRFAIAEAACKATMDTFAPMDKAGAFADYETARQYAQMASVYYRKIRNGKVLSPSDFNLAVDLCKAARRALQALDPEMKFTSFANNAELAEVERHTAALMQEYRALTGKA